MIVGSVPFKASNLPELHDLIKTAKYDFEYQVGSVKKAGQSKNMYSDEVKNLISKLLTVNPKERLTAEEALRHPWLRDAPSFLQDLFTEKEKG